jgi:hypothetical protein
MDFLANTSPLLRVIASFIVILVLSRTKLSLGVAMFAGAVSLGLTFGMRGLSLPRGIWRGASDPGTLVLIFVVAMIIMLSNVLQSSGQLKRIVGAFTSRSKRGTFPLIALPALIGLLPMPGGALFSAPMVNEAAGKRCVSPEGRTVINHWFRHMWEFWWPLYPGVILALALSGLAVEKFIIVMLPFTAVNLGAGYFFLLRGEGAGEAPAVKPKGQGSFLREMAPILVIICAVALTAIALFVYRHVGAPADFTPPRYLAIFIALPLGLLTSCLQNGVGIREFARVTLNLVLARITFLVFGVMVFREILEVSGAVGLVAAELDAYGIPLISVVMILPLLTGVITGIGIGFVGTSFPLVIALLAQAAPGASLLPYVMLAYAFGYIGMMLSPVHLCLVLTKDFFKAGWWGSYRLMLLPCLVVALVAVPYFYLLERLID